MKTQNEERKLSIEPEHINMSSQCRVCGSKNMMTTDVSRDFYLFNMDQIVCMSYCVCRDCQFITQSEYVGDAFLKHYYNTSTMLRRDYTTAREMKGYRQQSVFIDRYRPLMDARILEIGADTGQFLMHLKYAYNCDVYFNELNAQAKEVMRQRKVLKDFDDVSPGTKVDVVVLRHVIEHVYDLNGFMRYLDSTLDDNGILFIEIPDWSYMDEYTDEFIFEHLSQFNVYNITLFLKNHGFVIEQMEKAIWKEYRSTPNRVIRIIARRTTAASLGSDDIKNNVQDYYKSTRRIFDAIDGIIQDIPQDAAVALYPASGFTFETLLNTGMKQKNIAGIYDADLKKCGRSVAGIEVYHRDELKRVDPDYIFILTHGGFEKEIRESIEAMSLRGKIFSWTDIKYKGVE